MAAKICINRAWKPGGKGCTIYNIAPPGAACEKFCRKLDMATGKKVSQNKHFCQKAFVAKEMLRLNRDIEPFQSRL
jgi:hypothetical protein